MAGPSSGDGTPDTAHSTVFQSNAIAPDSGPELVGEAPRLDPISISPLSAIEPIPMTLQNPSPSTPPRSNLISAIDTGQPAQPSPVATEPGLKTREAPKSRPISPDDKDFASRDEQRMHEEILVPLVPVRGTSLKRPLRRETTLRIVSKAQAAPPSPSHALTAPGIGIVDQFEWLDEEADDKEEVHWSTRETRLTRLMAKLRKQSPGKMAIISAIIGSIMLLIPGIVDLVLFVENPLAWWTNMRPVVDSNGNPLFVLGGYPVFYWTVWSIVTWNVFWLAWYFVPVLPYISLRIHFAITGYVSQSWQDRVVQLARVTKTWTTICITTLASYLTFRSAFVNTIALSATMGSFLRISLIVSLIWLLTKLSFARFARSFQRRVYQERREKIRFEQFVLEQLQTAVIKVKEQSSAGTATDSPESDAPSGVSGKPRSRTLERFKTAVSNISVPKLTPLAGQEDYDPRGASMIEPPALQFDSLMDAKLLARDLYQSILELHQKNTEPMSSPDSVVAPDPASATLRIRTAADGHAEIPFSAFSGYFADPRLAKQAFSLFDLNSDGWASRYDFKEAVVKMYEDKQALHANIENGWQALDKLDSLISILLWVVSAILFLSVFLDLSVWIAAFASAWAGAVFAFQSSIKSLIESIIFLFVTHPFDVGDRISFQGDSYFVKAMTIMSSTLTHTDGREVYLSNPVLSQYFIYNIRRSGSQIETIRVAVDVTTTAEMFSKLTAELNKEIKETYYREFVPNLEAFIEKVKFEQRTATMVMWLTHRSNFQAGAARWRRTTLFMTLLKEKMKLCGIKAGQMKVIEVEGLSQYYAARSRDGGTMASTRSSGTRAARPPSFPGMPSDSTGLRRRI